MSLRPIFLFFLLLIFTISQLSYGQIIADFTFSDTSNMPASLKKNLVGPDAININPRARSNGEGVFTLIDANNPLSQQNIDLEVPESLLNQTESVYLEFDYRSQEEFAWFIFSGYVPGVNLFRFAHVNYPDRPEQQGFHVRYSTAADPGTVITSGYVGEPMERGERALIAFMYNKEQGAAFIFKNGNMVWETPDHLKTPGYGLHWQTTSGTFMIGANMDGEGSKIPSLYRFRAFEHPCVEVLPPVIEGATVCQGEQVTLSAHGGEEGQYRWYRNKDGNIALLEGFTESTFTTASLTKSETFYVSIANEICETPMAPVQVMVNPIPKTPNVEYTPTCGPGEVTIYFEEEEENEYIWYSEENIREFHHQGALTIQVNKDTVVYVKARKGTCESEAIPVFIRLQALPTIHAGLDQTILKGESVDLSASGDFSSCFWTSADPSLQFADSPTPRVSPEVTQDYIVTALHSNGCEGSDTVRVFVMEKFMLPNAFSPNNDGINDTWIIPNIERYPECKLLIFNRWGNQIFFSEGYREPWDGTQNGKPLPFGTYYYTLKLNNEEEVIKGSVVIIR